VSGTFQEPLSKARRDEVGQSRCEKIARHWPVRLRRLLCGKPAAFRQVAEAKEFNPKPEGPEGAEPFRTAGGRAARFISPPPARGSRGMIRGLSLVLCLADPVPRNPPWTAMYSTLVP